MASDGKAANVNRLWSEAKPEKSRAPVPTSRADLKRLAADPFTPEETRANICSIAVLLEHRGRRLLLTGDGHPHVYEPALEALVKDRENQANPSDDAAAHPPFVIDAVKVAHHGSSDNTSPALRAYRVHNYLFSTNGERHDHPDSESLARLIVEAEVPPTFHFNFPTHRVLRWASLAAELGDFSVIHPPVGATVQVSSTKSPAG